MTQYNPQLPGESSQLQPTIPTTNDMQQFYIATLSIVAIVSLAMILIYAMRRT